MFPFTPLIDTPVMSSTTTLRLIFLLTSLIITLKAYSETFRFGDILYSVLSADKVAVVPAGEEAYVGDVLIPQTVTSPSGKSYKVSEVSPWSFAESGVTSVTVKGSLERIGEYAFYSCSELESVEIQGSVSSMGRRTFAMCPQLHSFIAPNGPTIIPSQCFYEDSSLDRLETGADVVVIDEGAFFGCKALREMDFGSSLREIATSGFEGCSGLTKVSFETSSLIGDYAFRGCKNLSTVDGFEILESIGREAFASCVSLRWVEFMGALTEMGEGCFMNCNGLTSVYVKGMQKEIPAFAFSNCDRLEKAVIGGKVRTIGDMAFKNCPRLNEVVLQSSVKNIGYETFDNCDALKKICILSIEPPVASYGAFATDAYTEATLYVPIGYKQLFSQNGCWENFKNIVETDEDPSGVSTITIDQPKITWLTGNTVRCESATADFIFLDLTGRTPLKGSLIYGDVKSFDPGMLIIGTQKFIVR